MLILSEVFSFNWKLLSWEKSRSNLLRLQRRLFKAISFGDMNKALEVQKLILKCSSTRLLAIRDVTQISFKKRIAGVDGKVTLTFLERFQLNDYMRVNYTNWKPQRLKKLSFLKSDGSLDTIFVSSIADRVWQTMISFAILPAHEAIFHPRNFGFRLNRLHFDAQKIVFLNLSFKSFSIQKRVLVVDVDKSLCSFDSQILMKKLIAPRFVKLGIFRFFKFGLVPKFLKEESELLSINSILANILLSGIENLHPSCVRFGGKILFFLKPFDDEKILSNKILSCISSLGLSKSLVNLELIATTNGFDFIFWNFKVKENSDFICTPSMDSYQLFLKRVKHIVTNSNYGAV